MLVVEHRHRAAAVLEDLHDLLEEFVPRIQRLPFLVAPVSSVLSDEHHAVDAERAPAEGQGLCNRRIQLHRWELAEASLAHIVVPDLVDVDRDEIHVGVMMRPVPAVPLEETVHNVLRMGILEIGRADRGQLRPRRTPLGPQHQGSGSHAEE